MLRLLIAAAALGTVVIAQIGRHDDWFPLGMLGQYAEPRDPNGLVVSTYLEAVTSDGQTHPIRMSAATTGLQRVELEVMLPQLREDPSGLAPIAERLRVSRSDLEITSLRVGQLQWQFVDGAVPAEPEDVTMVTWPVEQVAE